MFLSSGFANTYGFIFMILNLKELSFKSFYEGCKKITNFDLVQYHNMVAFSFFTSST